MAPPIITLTQFADVKSTPAETVGQLIRYVETVE